MSELAIAQKGQDDAPFLFSLPEADLKLEEREKKGEWTGERLFVREPRLYQSIVRGLGMGLTVEALKELLGVSDNTVRNVRDRESTAVADFRTKQGVKRRRILAMTLDRIEQLVPSADLKDVVIAHGILDDKERLDSGAPTQRIEVAMAPAQDVYHDLVKEIIDVRAEVVPVTGCGVGRSLANGGAAGADRGLVLEGELAVSDRESGALPSDSAEATAQATGEGGSEA